MSVATTRSDFFMGFLPHMPEPALRGSTLGFWWFVRQRSHPSAKHQ
jgi:hypothetical protein